MLASINPLGERARGTRFARTFTWYLVGSTAGGAIVGACMGAVGVVFAEVVDPSPRVVAGAVIVVAGAALVFELGIGGVRVPSVRRQVDEDWLVRYRGWVYGLGFGFQLGVGIITVVSTTTLYLVLLFEALSSSIVAGAIIGMSFGLARSVPLLAVRRVREPGQLRSLFRTVRARSRAAESIARLAIVSVGVVAAVGLVGHAS